MPSTSERTLNDFVGAPGPDQREGASMVPVPVASLVEGR